MIFPNIIENCTSAIYIYDIKLIGISMVYNNVLHNDSKIRYKEFVPLSLVHLYPYMNSLFHYQFNKVSNFLYIYSSC